MIFTEENFNLLLQKDIETFIFFDDNGLLIGPDELIEDYVKRLRILSNNITEFNKESGSKNTIELLNTRFGKESIIPGKMFDNANDRIKTLYDITIDWVPGFFSNHKMGLLFAGYAIYSFDDFFAVFIIRAAFRDKEKWLIYSRTELIAHELCHIAHIGFNVNDYEEFFAYQTSPCLFRRLIGGALRTPTDTYMILGAVGLMFSAQMINICFRSPLEWHTFPMPLVSALTVSILLFIAGRYCYSLYLMNKANRNLTKLFDKQNVMPILFRCSTAELKKIVQLNTVESMKDWMYDKKECEFRWQLILRKYRQKEL